MKTYIAQKSEVPIFKANLGHKNLMNQDAPGLNDFSPKQNTLSIIDI